MGMWFLYLLEIERSCPKAQQNTLLTTPIHSHERLIFPRQIESRSVKFRKPARGVILF